MIGYIAALLYGALTLLFLAVLGLQIGSPVVVFFIALAAASAYLCQLSQLAIESVWPATALWALSVVFTILAIVAAGGKALVY